MSSNSVSAHTAIMLRGRGRRVCVKCAMLISGDYSRNDLATRYTVRELRAFLVGCKMTVAGCTEKADLIELAMTASHAPNRLHREDAEHASHVARLKVRAHSLVDHQYLLFSVHTVPLHLLTIFRVELVVLFK